MDGGEEEAGAKVHYCHCRLDAGGHEEEEDKKRIKPGAISTTAAAAIRNSPR